MDLIFRIVYAAHANGSHHKLALESLRHLSGEGAEGWRRVFLKHAEVYLKASKAPDNEFKDFKNHVLHTADGYWGGAPEKVVSWYDMLVAALREQRWPDAVYCAGVLSHYYTDPHHPFHTGQSEAENNIHRAVEWSISRSFDDLLELGRRKRSAAPASLPAGEHWLTEHVCRGADRSHAHYERLIAHYDFGRGVVDPPAGLDAVARELVGDIIVYATAGFALILDRAFSESGARPPEVELTAETVIAALKIPIKWVAKKIADSQERRLVERMYDELMATGRVEKNLPEDDRTVRDLHAAEALRERKEPLRIRIATKPDGIKPPVSAGVREPSQWRRAAGKPRLMQRLAGLQEDAQPPAEQRLAVDRVPAEPPRPAPPQPRPEAAAPVLEPAVPNAAPTPGAEPPVEPAQAPDDTRWRAPAAKGRPDIATSIAEVLPIAPSTRPGDEAGPMPVEAGAGAEAIAPNAERPRADGPPPARRSASSHRQLMPEDDVVDAPSIGPRTAERLYAAGVRTVADLLAADPESLAATVATRHISARTIADWQSQARLVCDLPGLRSAHAQLLVGAGFRTFERLLAADVATLQADVLRYAATTDGQRALRSGEPPDLEQISRWIELARDVKATQAA